MTDESLFREVDEEVRKQQLEVLWKRWGNVIIAAAVLVFVGVAAFKGWQHYELKRAEAGAAAYFEAVQLADAGKAEEAAKKFAELSAGGHAGFALLAKMEEASALAAAGKTADAVKAYDAIAAQANLDSGTRNAMRIRAALLLLDSAPAAEITKRVGDLDTPENVWRNEAREILGLSAYRARDYLTADKLMNEILSDPEAPAGLRQRAQVMVSLLAPRLDQAQPAVQ